MRATAFRVVSLGFLHPVVQALHFTSEFLHILPAGRWHLWHLKWHSCMWHGRVRAIEKTDSEVGWGLLESLWCVGCRVRGGT